MDKPILQYSSNNFFMNHVVTESPDDVATHIHDCYELFYLISGDLTYYIEVQAYKLCPNDLILTNSRELHRIVFNSKARYERKYIHFKPEYISSYQSDEYSMLSFIENRKLGILIEYQQIMSSKMGLMNFGIKLKRLPWNTPWKAQF
ncbi:AraC family ligand binding domain-containing protein [Neobacillus niacini]|jgi:AraC-like ligand binding domain|uniref:AraC family ligand binding domain-containing protein n=1 Tax=Neobacillus niacini TaxID=86668 RepID=UPI0021AEF272|nr:AraC family ligand binding domain-containing protein [Neobacillus niacini]